ncbi:hypothetical protein [Bacteroides oleiciplenus]|uniref:SH3b domain-containing protein n=1 Tax=Bacteroides oleiciplenus YIT 12058 TaxID=742727 RepID=K9E0P4_9BACE|nr:hypothetical protein [Bacteroides oleiciplenus]EKU90318.1 hypothetical protein HMPREF9447_01736 [Bacteroides oleiciplenus YIT 12058]
MKKILITILLLCAISEFTQAQTVITKFKCYLLSPDMDLSRSDKVTVGDTKIGYIPKNKEIQVLALDTIKYIFYKVQYKNKVGYIHKDVVVDKSLMISIDPNIRSEYKKYVAESSVVIGMNKYELQASIGNPLDVNRTVTADHVSEQWCYGDVVTHYYTIGFTLHSISNTKNNKYIYIEDGIVTAYQD